MAELKWTEEASIWLKDIFDYIAEENPLAAQRVVEGIYDKTQILKSFPEIGYKYRKLPEGEIRVLLYGHYRIAYFVKDNSVEILGIFHGALKIEKYLKE
jgi:plasmid stabilization system protein ParE